MTDTPRQAWDGLEADLAGELPRVLHVRASAAQAAAVYAATVAAFDDQDRVAALRRALEYADGAMAEAQRMLRDAAGAHGPTIDRLASARREAAVALSLEHGEA